MIDGKIILIGDKFRGLWLSREYSSDRLNPPTWSVTFLYDNDMAETVPCATADGALDCAIAILGL